MFGFNKPAPVIVPVERRTFRIEGDKARAVFSLIDDRSIAKKNGVSEVASYDLWAYLVTLHPEVATGNWSINTKNSLVVVLQEGE